MALAENRLQRTITLCALYFAQGIPWGFMAIVLVSYLTERGLDESGAGSLKAVILLPWTFKLIWAPMIDSVTVRSMGRRRFWIITAEVLMALTLLGMLWQGADILTGEIDVMTVAAFLAVMFFIHNCFASMQDVCTDALAVDILPPEEQGLTNGLMWGSKLVGKGGGAGLLAWIIANTENGLLNAILAQFIALLVIMLLPLFLVERKGEKILPWTRGEAQGVLGKNSIQDPYLIIRNLFTGFSLVATLFFALFPVLAMLSLGSIEVITSVLYPQQLGWTFDEYSAVTGTGTIVPSLIGTILGGILGDRYGRRSLMAVGIIGFSLIVTGFSFSSELWDERWLTTTFLIVYPAFVACYAVNFLAGGMNISWTVSAASMFTVYMTLSNVGDVLGKQFAGPLAETFTGSDGVVDYPAVLRALGLGSLVPLFLLPLIDFGYVKRLKEGGESSAVNAIPNEFTLRDLKRLDTVRYGIWLMLMASIIVIVYCGIRLLGMEQLLSTVKHGWWVGAGVGVIGLCLISVVPNWNQCQSMMIASLGSLLLGALTIGYIESAMGWLGAFEGYVSILAGFFLVVAVLLFLTPLRELGVAVSHRGALFSSRLLIVYLFCIFLIACLVVVPLRFLTGMSGEVRYIQALSAVLGIISWGGVIALIGLTVLLVQLQNGIGRLQVISQVRPSNSSVRP